jgi:hypothetical protein
MREERSIGRRRGINNRSNGKPNRGGGLKKERQYY